MSFRRLAVLTLSVAIAAEAAGSGVAFALATNRRSPRAPGPPPAKVPPEIAKVLAGIEDFVARTRGLAFKHPVEVEMLSDEAFVDRRKRDEDGGKAYSAVDQGELEALGLIPAGVDLNAAYEQQQSDQVVGFYYFDTKTLLLRGTVVTPLVKISLAHELTHALDDQWFGIDRRKQFRDLDDEQARAFLGLVEGSARWVENRYRHSLSEAENKLLDDEIDAIPTRSTVPDAIYALQDFPYSVGVDFVDYLRDKRGVGGVNDAFAHPPVSTEQLYHPSRYLRGDAPSPVPNPPNDRLVADRGSFGEERLFLMLWYALPENQKAPAYSASTGWGGGRYFAWLTPDRRTCIRVSLTMDEPTDQTEVASALARWAAKAPGKRTTTPDGHLFTACT